MSRVMLAGVEWQVDYDGALYRETASGEALMSVEQSHPCKPARYWGVIELRKDMRPGAHVIRVSAFASQEEAAVAVLALARKRAAELLELAGGAS